jgi:lysophospholipase L1-like esterase
MLTAQSISRPVSIEQDIEQPRVSKSWKRPLLKLISLALSLTAALAVAEVALRIWWEPPERRDIRNFNFRSCMMPDPELGHVPRPDALVEYPRFGVSFRTNGLGLRGCEYPVERTPGMKRIVVLGDSMAWGHGVAEPLAFPELIERQCPATEVINLGVPGYNLRSERTYFERIGAKYRPDVVVLAICQNDVVDHDAWARRREAASHPPIAASQHAASIGNAFSSVKQFLTDHSRVYRAAQEAVNAHKPLARAAVWLGLKDELAGFEGLDENLHSSLRTYPPTVEHAMNLLEADLLRLDAAVRSGGAKLVVVLIPSLQAVDASQLDLTLAYTSYAPKDFELDKPYLRLEQFARSNQMDLINPVPRFRHAHDCGEALYLSGDLHPSAKGHALIAECILRELEQRR